MAERARLICVMGVAGCGKTTVGEALAEALGAEFLEADRLHPATNIARMSAGTPLTDDDRWPWLDAVGAAAPRAGRAVIACSALRRVYRERLASGAGEPIFFVHLTGPKAEIASRMGLREGHFMPTTLLDSQFATLEPPERDEPHMTLDIRLPLIRMIDIASKELT
ncbi:MAG: gluconokinase [Paracoccaceae bacterium]